MPVSTPIPVTDEQLALVTYDADGLVPAIVQEEGTGQVLMMAWMNAESLRRTLEEGRTVFWSRSRQEVWRKGDTSGDRQFVREAYYDCDGDTLLFVVEQEGKGACHTGEYSCFFRAFGPEALATAPTAGADRMLRPSRDEFRELAADHTVVPVWRELLADLITPVARSPGSAATTSPGFLLESVEHGERWSRWSFVGREPAGHPRRSATASLDGHRRRCPAAMPTRRGHPRRGRVAARALPLPGARRPAAAARRARRLPRLRRGARGRAPARRAAATTTGYPDAVLSVSASWRPSTTCASGSP